MGKEREALKSLYKFKSWALRVDKMTDAQVIAIYLSAKRRGKL
jgi:hypothetical protein